jgi:O-antigen biosynthesis protein WbqV
MISMNIRTLATHARRLIVDVALSGAAFFTVTMFPLLQQNMGFRSIGSLVPQLIIYVMISAGALHMTRTYHMIWRYMGFRDFLRLVVASTLTLIGFMVFEFLFMVPNMSVPGTLLVWVIILLWIANIGFLAAPRFFMRTLHEMVPHKNGRPVLLRSSDDDILLTGDVTRINAFIRECESNTVSRYRVMGVLADDPRLRGSYLQGVKVLDSVDNLGAVMKYLAEQGSYPRMLVVAPGDNAPTDFTRYLELANAANIRIGRLPPPGALTVGEPIKPIELSDLLGRPEIKIDTGAVAKMIEGKCVLITGAGGSIGSELSRQIARLKPSRLVVLDASEFNLYSINAELSENHPEIVRETALVDVRDAALVSNWVGRTRPSIVFHAAALKHVPLLEEHPIEGIKTNVFGTVNVADACRTHRVSVMVTISTDKAVNPTNVMGATKRLAEAYCQGLDLGSDATRFIMVRFGNVLGSAGSVVPLFRRQIEAGGPVTVTHPDITRYFMTIPEAVTLVMTAGAQAMEVLDERGNIYLLDMGEPVKIMDLARQMIRLSRRRVDRDVEIRIIGLRPGEKLYEELNHSEEKVQPTRSKAILKLAPRATDLRIIRQQVQELRLACTNEDRERVLRLLKISVPDYAASLDSVSAAKS